MSIYDDKIAFDELAADILIALCHNAESTQGPLDEVVRKAFWIADFFVIEAKSRERKRHAH